MWFSIWSSLIVITDEGRNPETGWLRSYLVYIFPIYFASVFSAVLNHLFVLYTCGKFLV